MAGVVLLRPDSIDEAVAQLIQHPNSALFGGGTALVTQIRSGKKQFDTWISTEKLGLGEIRRDRDGLHLGATVTLTQLVEDPDLRHAPYCLLREAVEQVASWQIRNAATLGGCIASAIPGADPLGALLVLDARITWYDADGCHNAPLRDILGMQAQRELPREAVLTEVLLPPPAGERYLCFFRKAAVRKASSWPLVNFAACIQKDETMITHCAVAVGGMAPHTMLLTDLMTAMTGQQAESLRFDALESALFDQVQPKDSLQGSAAYKKLVCRGFLLSFYETLTGREANDEAEYGGQ